VDVYKPLYLSLKWHHITYLLSHIYLYLSLNYLTLTPSHCVGNCKPWPELSKETWIKAKVNSPQRAKMRSRRPKSENSHFHKSKPCHNEEEASSQRGVTESTSFGKPIAHHSKDMASQLAMAKVKRMRKRASSKKSRLQANRASPQRAIASPWRDKAVSGSWMTW